ncbi:hypothetical protein Zmor_009946 [Zophobas morio]|uniref:Uncharacterized protein n=1 Tax=Zophobas morio TaxID=2755281 RepID=A0AA38MJ77_9CUCU|nr:hypothetical protein Zmor_009946 [Zophobas morio]
MIKHRPPPAIVAPATSRAEYIEINDNEARNEFVLQPALKRGPPAIAPRTPRRRKCERGRDGPRTQSMERHQLKRPALNKHQLVKTVLIKGIIIMLYRDLSCPDLDS